MTPFGAASRVSCKNICATSLYFDFGIGISFDHIFEFKTGLRQMAFHLFGLKEMEIQRDRFIPPFGEMYILLPDVKRQQKSSARTQHPFHLPHRINHRWAGNVNDGIEGRNASERVPSDAG